jgi:DNA-binding winged helix-turn-helix (wHTH) protein
MNRLEAIDGGGPRTSPRGLFAFGPFTLDPAAARLTKEGAVVRLQPLVFEVLHYLLKNRERVVSNDELLREVWRGATVRRGVVSWTVSRARQALGQAPASSAPIRTARKRGYQFVGLVHEEPAPRAGYHRLARLVRAALEREAGRGVPGRSLDSQR